MQLALSDITQFSHDLHRPEGAMVARDGTVWAADERGGCARITPDGEHTLVGDLQGMPNGICIDTNGDIIVANIGNGQLQRLHPDGRHEVLATHADGRALKAPNFPYVDSKGRIWVSHSTDAEPRRPAIWEPRPDGAIAVIEGGQARLAATEVYFANGFTMDAKEEYLYIAETSTIRIMRFPVRADGTLGRARAVRPAPGREFLPRWLLFRSSRQPVGHHAVPQRHRRADARGGLAHPAGRPLLGPSCRAPATYVSAATICAPPMWAISKAPRCPAFRRRIRACLWCINTEARRLAYLMAAQNDEVADVSETSAAWAKVTWGGVKGPDALRQGARKYPNQVKYAPSPVQTTQTTCRKPASPTRRALASTVLGQRTNTVPFRMPIQAMAWRMMAAGFDVSEWVTARAMLAMSRTIGKTENATEVASFSNPSSMATRWRRSMRIETLRSSSTGPRIFDSSRVVSTICLSPGGGWVALALIPDARFPAMSHPCRSTYSQAASKSGGNNTTVTSSSPGVSSRAMSSGMTTR